MWKEEGTGKEIRNQAMQAMLQGNGSGAWVQEIQLRCDI
jgi:hypothetical protein